MPTPSNTDTIPQAGFDPLIFWQKHKAKVIIYGSLIIVVVLAYVFYKISSETKLTNARLDFAKATSDEDLRQVIQKYPHTVAAGNASLELAEKLRAEKKYDDAIAVLQAMISDEPNHPLIDGAWMSIAATYSAEGKPDQAIDAYQQVAVTKYADRFTAPLAAYSIAQILQGQGKLDAARTAYENLNSQFPNSYYSQEAVQKLKDLKK